MFRHSSTQCRCFTQQCRHDVLKRAESGRSWCQQFLNRNLLPVTRHGSYPLAVPLAAALRSLTGEPGAGASHLGWDVGAALFCLPVGLLLMAPGDIPGPTTCPACTHSDGCNKEEGSSEERRRTAKNTAEGKKMWLLFELAALDGF